MSQYLFIDGGCLRSAVRKICADTFGDENAYQPLVSALARGSFDKVFYYDAVPGKDHNEPQATYAARVQPDHDRFDKIQALDRVHVQLGQIVGRDKRQKGVDVQLAVDMLTHAFRGNMTAATLFAGDADFVPLIRALVGQGLHVTLWHPSQANAELKGAADSTRVFNFSIHNECFTSDGETSAFRTASTGGSVDPANYGVTRLVNMGGHEHAAQWRNGTLMAWRGIHGNWTFISFVAPGATLARVLTAFDAAHGWGISAMGEDWVEA